MVGDFIDKLSSSSKVTYDSKDTVRVKEITPKYGSVLGGEKITLTTSNLRGVEPEAVSITFDGILCDQVEKESETSLTCITGERKGLPKHSIEVYI